MAHADSDFNLAIRLLHETEASLVIVREGRVLIIEQAPGLRSLLTAAERLRANGDAGAAVADTVVGRAAALVAAWGMVRAVHGGVVSERAYDELRRRGMAVSYHRLIPIILNRERRGPCPFEAAVADVTNPEDAVAAIKAIFAAMVVRRGSGRHGMLDGG